MQQDYCPEHNDRRDEFLRSQSPSKKGGLRTILGMCFGGECRCFALGHPRENISLPANADTRLIEFAKQLRNRASKNDESSLYYLEQIRLLFQGFLHFVPDIEPEQCAVMSYLHVAAEQNYAWAMEQLGWGYVEWEPNSGMNCVFQNDNVAIQWFRKAAEQGDRDAMYDLGCLCRGRGNLTDTESHEWLLKAANLDHSESMLEIAKEFLSGYGEVAHDEVLGQTWIRRAFESMSDYGTDDRAAFMTHIVEFERPVIGKRTNWSDTFLDLPAFLTHIRVECYQRWNKQFREENGALRRIFLQNIGWRLGLCYLHGIGVPTPDKTQGIEWLQRSVDSGSVSATWRLGECYLLGYGVPQNSEKAEYLLRDAADKHNPKAQWLLNYIAGHIPEKEQCQVDWFEDAYLRGIMTGVFRIGDYDLEQFGFSRNKAIDRYVMSAKLGNEKARHRLDDRNNNSLK